MMRYPDVSATQIVFSYAGDIWVVPKSGGLAERLSSPRGEEIFPRFSPDGSQIAFSGNYDGNLDIYVVPAIGGLPRRLTYHGAADRLLEWYPDGNSLLFASTRTAKKIASISSSGFPPKAACQRRCRCLTANSVRFHPMARPSPTCRSAWISAPGNVIAAG